jgi:signal transduction histidine kinase
MDEKDRNARPADEFCLLDTEDGGLTVAILGTGPGFASVLDLIAGEACRAFLPPLRLAALAEPGDHPERLEKARALGLPVYDRCADMIAAHPEVNLLIELTGSRPRLRELRRCLPDTVSLVDHAGAVFLCGLQSMVRSGDHFRRNLDRQRELLAAIIDEVEEDVLLVDRQGRVVDLNRNAAAGAAGAAGAGGVGRGDEGGGLKEGLLGRPCWEVEGLGGGPFCPGGQDPACPLHAALSTGRKAEALFTRVNAQGQLLYFRLYAYPVPGPGGRADRVLIMRRDISERTRQEKLREQAGRMAVLGEMSAYLAHEIRNPLFAIAGFTNSLLRMDSVDAKEREKLTVIAEEAKRLDRMLGSLLNFARPAVALPGEADPARVVTEAVELMTLSHGHLGHRFLVVAAPGLPRVAGEAEQLKQCLVNLLMNAVEAMPGGGQTVLRTALEGDLVAIRVEDAGRGLTPEELDQAFSPFFTTKAQGYGLGLATTRKIVEELGGRVELASVPGRGTTAALFLRPALPG